MPAVIALRQLVHPPTSRRRADLAKILIPLTSAGLAVVSVWPLAAALRLDALGLGIALAAFFCVFGFVLSAIEAVAFSAGPSPIKARDLAGAAALYTVLATVTAVVLPTAAPGSIGANCRDYVATNGLDALALRVALAATIFMVAYNVIGSIAWLLVKPYYERPDSPLRLRVPTARVIIPLQLGRGLLATLALLPILLSIDFGSRYCWLRLSLATAVVMSVVPLMNNRQWPVRLRLIHCVEIVLFAFGQSFAWCRLFGT
jgi:hypothetical protein